ncbi:MAG: phosphate signaling complex protein PhoU [Devosiaceae bacterium]|nr:phosphate signaling complex protein PhoU [Devosiaceae bacterium]
MSNTHIVHAFDKDLEKVTDLLLEMGGLVETQLSEAIKSVVSRDLALGKKVRKTDRRINELEQQINEKSVRLLALRQPMAEDLRIIVAVMKAASNLERIGDYAKNIAKRASVLSKFPPVASAANTLVRMNKMVHQMIVDVLNAFVNRDSMAAEDVRQRDEEVDLMHNSLFRELLTYMMEDPRNISPCMHLLFIAKNIERCGDHTVQIAEQIHYLVEGNFPADRRPKGDKTSTMMVEFEDE